MAILPHHAPTRPVLRRLHARLAGHVQARNYRLSRGFAPARFQPATGQIGAVLTSRITGEERARLQERGGDALIDKPFSLAAFETGLARVFPDPQAAPRG